MPCSYPMTNFIEILESQMSLAEDSEKNIFENLVETNRGCH